MTNTEIMAISGIILMGMMGLTIMGYFITTSLQEQD